MFKLQFTIECDRCGHDTTVEGPVAEVEEMYKQHQTAPAHVRFHLMGRDLVYHRLCDRCKETVKNIFDNYLPLHKKRKKDSKRKPGEIQKVRLRMTGEPD